MLILALRTDKPEAEIALYKDTQLLISEAWQAHRQLAETIHIKIRDTLQRENRQLHDIQGIVLYKGPGSFTGLRIGAAVANALATQLSAAIVGETGKDWARKGIDRLSDGQGEQLVVPEYGAAVRTTPQKK